nr:hypothetical protein [Tanacetum cinerariifolium]
MNKMIKRNRLLIECGHVKDEDDSMRSWVTMSGQRSAGPLTPSDAGSEHVGSAGKENKREIYGISFTSFPL